MEYEQRTHEKRTSTVYVLHISTNIISSRRGWDAAGSGEGGGGIRGSLPVFLWDYFMLLCYCRPKHNSNSKALQLIFNTKQTIPKDYLWRREMEVTGSVCKIKLITSCSVFECSDLRCQQGGYPSNFQLPFASLYAKTASNASLLTLDRLSHFRSQVISPGFCTQFFFAFIGKNGKISS